MQGIDRRQLGRGIAYATTALLGQGKPEEPIIENCSPFLITNDGTKLFVQDWGHGRPLVFLSAWTFHSNVWGSYIAALTARGFRCIAPDRRGHGRSEAPNRGYDLNTLADDVATVMEQLDLRNVVLVAHSMGSMEAVAIAPTVGQGEWPGLYWQRR